MKKPSTWLCAIGMLCFGISCNQSDLPVDQLKQFKNMTIDSDHFKSMNVNVLSLNLEAATTSTTPSGRPILIIPYKLKGRENAVIGVFDYSNKLITTVDVHGSMKDLTHVNTASFKQAPISTDPDNPNPQPVEPTPVQPTNITPDDDGAITAAYHQGVFNGHVSMTASTYWNLNYNFHLSRPINATLSPIGTNGIRCNGITEPGGALDCAGKALTSQGPISSALCYIDFIPCFAAMVIDCLISGCA